MILKIFSPKNLANKVAVWTKIMYCIFGQTKIIATLFFFMKNAIFAENRQNSKNSDHSIDPSSKTLIKRQVSVTSMGITLAHS
jgi:hypothetical protein